MYCNLTYMNWEHNVDCSWQTSLGWEDTHMHLVKAISEHLNCGHCLRGRCTQPVFCSGRETRTWSMNTAAVTCWPSKRYLRELFSLYHYISHLRQTDHRSCSHKIQSNTNPFLQWLKHCNTDAMNRKYVLPCPRSRGNQGKHAQLLCSQLIKCLLETLKQSRTCPVFEPKMFLPMKHHNVHATSTASSWLRWAKIAYHILPKCDRSLWSVHCLSWWCWIPWSAKSCSEIYLRACGEVFVSHRNQSFATATDVPGYC